MAVDWGARSVVGALSGHGASELSVAAAATLLLSERDWTVRMDMLQTDGRLVDLSIARWCAERGDELLAAVIRRIVEAGVDTGRAELPLVLALIDLPADGRSSEHVVIAVHDAVAAVREGGASWLLPWLWNALARLATSEGGIEGILQGVVEPLLRDLVGCNETEVSAARELVALDWPVVWEKLGELADLQGLRAACAVVAQVADWFDRGSGKSRSATDLGELLAAAEQEAREELSLEFVQAGESILDVYPPGPALRAELDRRRTSAS